MYASGRSFRARQLEFSSCAAGDLRRAESSSRRCRLRLAERLRLLVLGGTEFVGRAVLDDALTRGWDVTTLNRGTVHPHPSVTPLIGDRSRPDGLDALGGGEWDLVVDTWSWGPSVVRDAATMLADRVGRYAYISSRSVYTHPTPAGADETAPVVDGSPDDDHADDYARAKRGGELAAVVAFGDRALLARAGLILGPHENIGRLPWWLTRIAEGGDVLTPAPPESPLQYVDARDLAAFVLSAAERGMGGAVNVVSRSGHATMAGLLEACVRATGSSARLSWTDPATILAAEVQPWTGLPVWLPEGVDHDTMHGGDVTRAVDAGLVCRPIEETVRDTWTWLQSIGGVAPQRADRPVIGIPRELEETVLRR